MNNVSWFVALAFCAATLPAYAQGGLTLGRPAYGGPGCPAGTASSQLSGNGSLSIRFSRFGVAAGGVAAFDRKACSLAIPMRVPAGQSVAVLSVAYRGRTDLSAGGKGVLTVESFLSGGQGPVFRRSFSGPVHAGFAVQQAATATTWSACGAAVTLRTNTSLEVTSAGGAVAASLRSQDVSTAIVYRLQFRNC
jgi:hypothetical protein